MKNIHNVKILDRYDFVITDAYLLLIVVIFGIAIAIINTERESNREVIKFMKTLRISTLIVCFALILSKAHCRNLSQTITLEQLNTLEKSNNRAPGAFIPSDSIEESPVSHEIWINEFLSNDEHGILSEVRDQINNWIEMEENEKRFNLEETGLVEIPSNGTQKNYISKKLLKYVDKRISGEIKNAPEGSNWKKVGEVQTALKPQTRVGITKTIKLKFKARVLSGRAIMNVENPYVDANATYSLSGKAHVNISKDFKELGVKSAVEYDVKNGQYFAYVDKNLTDSIRARISSSQSDKDMAFSENADKRLELLYGIGF